MMTLWRPMLWVLGTKGMQGGKGGGHLGVVLGPDLVNSREWAQDFHLWNSSCFFQTKVWSNQKRSESCLRESFFTDERSLVYKQCYLGIVSWSRAAKKVELNISPIFFFEIAEFLISLGKGFLVIQIFFWGQCLLKQIEKKRKGGLGVYMVSLCRTVEPSWTWQRRTWSIISQMYQLRPEWANVLFRPLTTEK